MQNKLSLMLFKVGKIVFLLIFYCNIGCNKATKPKSAHSTAKVKHTVTVDSVALAFSKKTEKIPIEGPLQSKKPSLSDKLKTYTIDGDWLLTQFHNNHIEIDEYKTPVLGVDTLISKVE